MIQIYGGCRARSESCKETVFNLLNNVCGKILGQNLKKYGPKTPANADLRNNFFYNVCAGCKLDTIYNHYVWPSVKTLILRRKLKGKIGIHIHIDALKPHF